jgi:CheY-like chemotaxis protein
MPVMGGTEAMRRMQQIPDLRMVPVIAVSAGVAEDKRSASITAGAKAFLAKPIESTYLFQEISRLLKPKRLTILGQSMNVNSWCLEREGVRPGTS